MSRIAGVVVEKDDKGRPVRVSIDLRKRADLIAILIEHGILNVPNSDTIEAIEDAQGGNVTTCKHSKQLFKELGI